jgi:hypothetical protein
MKTRRSTTGSNRDQSRWKRHRYSGTSPFPTSSLRTRHPAASSRAANFEGALLGPSRTGARVAKSRLSCRRRFLVNYSSDLLQGMAEIHFLLAPGEEMVPLNSTA